MHARLLVLFILLAGYHTAHADTFGIGANQFDIEFVAIGDPDNPDDTTGDPNPAGKVEYAYRIGKFEISRDMITKANNEGSLGITMSSMSFVLGGARDDMPATGISWAEAATFVNWINTSSGHTPAYKANGSTFELWQSGDTGYNSSNPFRNSLAKYFLPSVDEWYKSAYYDPNSGAYYDYATGSDIAPTIVTSGTGAGTAVYAQFGQSPTPGPADVMLAGGLSPYGTMGQSGNVSEWEETEFDLVNDSITAGRGIRGGSWDFFADALESDYRIPGGWGVQSSQHGFRVASTPDTILGDLDGDGFVDGLDLGILLANWNTSTTPDMGELDGTAPVDGLDLGILLAAWNPPPATATIPEPSGAALALIAICFGLIRARR